MNRFSLPLSGLNCMNCAKKVEQHLQQRFSIEVHQLSPKLIELTTSACLTDIIDAIESLGYHAGNKLQFVLQGLNCGQCVNKLSSLLESNPYVAHFTINKTELSLLTTLSVDEVKSLVASLNYQALLSTDTELSHDHLSISAGEVTLDSINLTEKVKTPLLTTSEMNNDSVLDQPELITTYLLIKGMTCASCVSSVEKALRSVDAVNNVQIHLAEQSAIVQSHHHSQAWEQQLITAIIDAGYHAEIVNDPILQQNKSTHQLALQQKQHKMNSILGLSLGIPLMAWGGLGGNMMIQSLTEQIAWGIVGLLCFTLLATAGRHFFQKAWRSLIHKRATMDTLIALGTGAAWVYSMVVILFPHWFPASARHVYFEASAMIIGLISLGHYIEAKAKAKTTFSLQSLINLQPQNATLITPQYDQVIRVESIQAGMALRIKPGEKVPVDGKVTDGESYVDESMLTGEPIPVLKSTNDYVSAGTINHDGRLVIEATNVGSQTMLHRIIQMVRQAQSTKPTIAKLADQISTFFVPAIVVIAILSALVWYFIGPEPKISYMLITATTVLIIACPCALGLATPLSVTVGIGKAAEMGILIRDANILQSASKTNTVVFDKTGTLTQGKPSVQCIEPIDIDINKLLTFAYSLELHSEHPLAKAVCEYSQQQAIIPKPVEEFMAIRGKGISAILENQSVIVGSLTHLESIGVQLADAQSIIDHYAQQAWTPIAIAIDGKLKGLIAVADPIKTDAAKAIKELNNMNIHTVMLTGDNQYVADSIAKQLGINQVIAQVLPDQKADKVAELQRNGKIVAMVGDGINDAPALALANISIAMGSGSDIAIESAQITVLNSSPFAVVQAIRLSRATLKNIKQNLFGAFIYNVLGIPIAAGVLYPSFGFLLSPVVAGAAMALSSITVVSNANRLRLFKTQSN